LLGRLSCQETPKRSLTQANFSLNGYFRQLHQHHAFARELQEEAVNLHLALARDDERDGGRERELVWRSAVHREVVLAVEHELGALDRVLGLRLAGAVAIDACDAGVFEQGDVEVHRLFGLAVLVSHEH